MRRRVLPITAVFTMIAAAALSGCASADASDADSSVVQAQEECAVSFGPGPLSNSVETSGDSAENLRVTLNAEAEVRGPQRSVIAPAEAPGKVIETGDIVSANLAFVDSQTGEILQVSPGFGSERGDSVFLADSGAGTLVAGTLCAAAGDTLAIALTKAESESMGVQSPIVVVVEISGVEKARTEGFARPLPSGFPAVTTDHTGQPGIVLPPQDAPNETRKAVRIQGDGEEVTSADMVVGQVLSVTWDGTESKNTWAQAPESFGTGDEPAASFREQLNGFNVGSQVVIIEVGEGGAQVSVVDILAVS